MHVQCTLQPVVDPNNRKERPQTPHPSLTLTFSCLTLPQIESLKVDLGKKDAALAAAETKLETLKAHQSNQQEHIGVLQTSLSAKEQHIKNLQGEVRDSCIQ